MKSVKKEVSFRRKLMTAVLSVTLPLIALLLVKMFIGTDSLIASVLILQAAMPVAMCSVIFSEQYRADVNFAAKGVLLSSLLCIFTIPAFAILLQYS